MRGDWIKGHTATDAIDVDAPGVISPVDDVLGTYNAQSLKGEMV